LLDNPAQGRQRELNLSRRNGRRRITVFDYADLK